MSGRIFRIDPFGESDHLDGKDAMRSRRRTIHTGCEDVSIDLPISQKPLSIFVRPDSYFFQPLDELVARLPIGFEAERFPLVVRIEQIEDLLIVNLCVRCPDRVLVLLGKRQCYESGSAAWLTASH